MLKDVLIDMANGGSVKLCKIGEIYTSMDSETRKAFELAMKSDATTMDICRALKAEGISVGREYLGAKRRCFKNGDPMCCLNAKDSVQK
jgi:hypothetical protein